MTGRTTTDSAVGMEPQGGGMHKDNSAVEAIGRLEELARAATDRSAIDAANRRLGEEGPDPYNNAVSELRQAQRAFVAFATPQAILSLIESLRHSVEREAGLREAATAVLALPDAVAALGYLDRGIGTRTPTAAWLRLRAALDRRAGE